MTVRHLYVLVGLLALVVSGCGGGSSPGGNSPPPPPTGTYTASSGVAQKGPLIRGSTVVAQELTASLSPNGKQYSFQTTSDLGSFNPNAAFTSQYVAVSATGYYFDEVANALSGGTITLNGYSDLSAAAVLNVNLLTTLAYQRIQGLVANSGMTFANAQAQAESEVLAALNIPAGSYGHFNTLDLGQDTQGAALLAAISSVFVYGNTSGNLSAVVANVQSDLGEDGVISNAATRTTLAASARALNPAAVAANLSSKYASLGVQFTPSDIADWIDQDGDGLAGSFEFRVPDATQSTSFAVPSAVTALLAGKTVIASAGMLAVNGTVATGPVTIQTGDVVSLSPAAATFPDGVLTIYVMSGTTKLAKVSFVAGLSSITVTPADATVPAGLSQQLTATGTFTDASIANVTQQATWTSSSSAVATVDRASGIVTAIAPGTTTVAAAIGSVSVSVSFEVVAPTLQSITLVPTPLPVGVGIARSLQATGTYSDGSTLNLNGTATWETLAPSVATVTGGVVTGVSLGSTSISASVGNVHASVPVNVTTNTWSAAATMSIPRSGHTATVLNDGRVLVAGGSTNPATEIYDPVANAWTSARNMATARENHTATLLDDGRTLVAGGRNAGDYLAAAEIYDPVTNTWTPAAPMTRARAFHAATRLGNNKVLVAGGVNGAAGTNTSAEIYDVAANTWTQVASMAGGRHVLTATLLNDGKVLVVGATNGGCSTVPARPEVYDPATDVWSPAPNTLDVPHNHTATLLSSGSVMVAGGTEDSACAAASLASVEIYQPASNSWIIGASMTTARTNHSAVLLGDGKVMVTGGQFKTKGGANDFLASAEIFDPASNTWTSASSMATARSDAAVVRLPTGAVLLTGGRTRFGTQASSELHW